MGRTAPSERSVGQTGLEKTLGRVSRSPAYTPRSSVATGLRAASDRTSVGARGPRPKTSRHSETTAAQALVSSRPNVPLEG
eukprot:743612-Pyramimonas_sp.AAC.1